MERYWRTQRVIFRLLFTRQRRLAMGPENPLKVLILHRMKHPSETGKKRPEHDRDRKSVV